MWESSMTYMKTYMRTREGSISSWASWSDGESGSLISLLLSSLELSGTKTRGLKYKPSSKPLHISAKYLFSNRELYRKVQLPEQPRHLARWDVYDIPHQSVGGGRSTQKRVRTLLTFEKHCLREEITFGDPFEDSGVAKTFAWVRCRFQGGISSLGGQRLKRPGSCSLQSWEMCTSDTDLKAITYMRTCEAYISSTIRFRVSVWGNHPGDKIRANGTSQKRTPPSNATWCRWHFKGSPLMEVAICPDVVSRVVTWERCLKKAVSVRPAREKAFDTSVTCRGGRN